LFFGITIDFLIFSDFVVALLLLIRTLAPDETANSRNISVIDYVIRSIIAAVCTFWVCPRYSGISDIVLGRSGVVSMIYVSDIPRQIQYHKQRKI